MMPGFNLTVFLQLLTSSIKLGKTWSITLLFATLECWWASCYRSMRQDLIPLKSPTPIKCHLLQEARSSLDSHLKNFFHTCDDGIDVATEAIKRVIDFVADAVRLNVQVPSIDLLINYFLDCKTWFWFLIESGEDLSRQRDVWRYRGVGRAQDRPKIHQSVRCFQLNPNLLLFSEFALYLRFMFYLSIYL